MRSSRVEAFSDGVIAIIITVMVLELKRPIGAAFASLLSVGPSLFAYALSFVFLGIYWNNHHHMFQSVDKVEGAVLWANLHLLFWLSLVPFATEWMSAESFPAIPVGIYGILLLLCAFAYFLLTQALLKTNGKDSVFAKRLGKDYKGKISLAIYVVAVIIAWWAPYAAYALYVLVAMIWFVPDRRFENKTTENV